jgi:hypothetical protein
MHINQSRHSLRIKSVTVAACGRVKPKPTFGGALLNVIRTNVIAERRLDPSAATVLSPTMAGMYCIASSAPSHSNRRGQAPSETHREQRGPCRHRRAIRRSRKFCLEH